MMVAKRGATGDREYDTDCFAYRWISVKLRWLCRHRRAGGPCRDDCNAKVAGGCGCVAPPAACCMRLRQSGALLLHAPLRTSGTS